MRAERTHDHPRKIKNAYAAERSIREYSVHLQFASRSQRVGRFRSTCPARTSKAACLELVLPKTAGEICETVTISWLCLQCEPCPGSAAATNRTHSDSPPRAQTCCPIFSSQ